ncbi:MAG: nicotinate-nucleotide adenylyltransferase [Armatimonadetes bacterium]|nr:nicotinate-nucleotide adenylyltransferase [Armatimonadota bacterium]
MERSGQNLSQRKRLGLMGGTFDPIHVGHLVVAEEARTRFDLERVIFVPNNQPPHKKAYQVAQAEHRYAMCLLATASNPFFEVSREELERPGPSYTIDTIRAFRARLGSEVELYFITGADAVLEIMTWREPEAILAEAHVVAVHRPGFDLQRLSAAIGPEQGARILTMPMPGLEISSTDLRRRVAAGESIRYLTPEAVVDYIYKTGLYR